MSFKDTIGGRLIMLREKNALRQKDFAEIMGVTDKTVSRYEFGETSPTHDFLLRVIRQFNCDALWLFAGVEPRENGKELKESRSVYEAVPGSGGEDEFETSRGFKDFELIPYVDTQLSESGALVVSELEKGHFAFRKEWLRQITGNMGNLRILRVSGSGMAPTMRDGDFAIIDMSQTQIRGGGVFAIAVNNAVLIKRLEHSITGLIRIISDNPSFPPYELPISETRILARVIWLSGVVF
jgi:phage repressor protein C with HTH and peptisase S24 domain